MLQADSENTPTLALKSAILMLLGSLLMGFVITRSIYEYQKFNFVLDEVPAVEEMLEDPQPMILDFSEPLPADVPAGQEAEKIQTYVQTRFNGDQAEIQRFLNFIPTAIQIPAIGVESEVGRASLREVTVFGKSYKQWVAPNFMVGWHYNSAILGEQGNTVLNGHHNVNGEVFRDLSLLNRGDQIIVSAKGGDFYYQVATVLILPERFEATEVRLQNARWIQPSEDERLTLISCWPYESNTHRVVVVAYRIDPPAEATGPGN